MTNNNDNNNSLIEETGLNRKFFEGLIENANHLSSEDKKKIGEFKEFKNDTVGEVLKVGEKDKIATYDKLNVKDLPEDWELKLARLKELERLLSENEPKIEELKGWTDTFLEKKPQEVQEEIKELEAKNKEIEEELRTEKEQHSLTESELKEWKEAFLNQTASQLKQKVNELEEKVQEWTHFFDYRELEEIKQEIEKLRKRPELPINEVRFWDDYAQRKSIQQNKLDQQELEKEREKLAKLEQERNRFLQAANRILENIRIRRYALSKPVITVEQAQEAAVELLAETEKKYEDHLQGNAIDKDLEFELSIYPEKKEWFQQVLEWIKEARETSDYKKLYERWSGGEGYSKENDLAGSLALLKKYLEIMNAEVLQINNGDQIENKEILSNKVDQEAKVEEGFL